ncbi:transglycosylase SLT domain-containing protein [Sinorhizobium meliloti]|uniref:Transglycosylase SLT domain-containing protein n=1 Tax=Rhizobium meliloti TaxID=382 RepID=A0A6A8A1B1_RHIML|nr:lytic transglycosylase domain-containing protein [Sinorhizobium meliloti]MQW08208.1 transglycosylase SLT domain-containing protein [Sinorhizobium meliloti]
MRYIVRIAFKASIPLFAEKPSHPFVPLDDQTAGARSDGQGRPTAGACRAPLTAASTLAGWAQSGDGAVSRYAVLLFAGMLAFNAAPSAVMAQTRPVERPATVDPYAAHIAEASQRFGIPAAWIRTVMRTESAGDVRAISSAGAMGLMQVMPDTWAALRVRYRFGRDPYDPRDNILAGTAYLREMHNRYGNVSAMLAAYNAGPGRYDEYLTSGRLLPAETRAYVAALAPQIGGGATTAPVVIAAADPQSWTCAPLFVAPSERTTTANPVQSSERSRDTPAPTPVCDVSAIAPQSSGLFVARASAGGPE